MRFQFIFNMVIILLILIPITVGTDDKNDCISELQLYLQFQSFDKEEISSLSDYQHPEYCEGDLLRIKSIIIKNDANCSSKP